MTSRRFALVVAAGRGTRVGADVNKAFLTPGGRSILRRCLDALERAGCFDGALLVLSAEDLKVYRELKEKEGESPLVQSIVLGGPTRQQSVLNGLRAMPEDVSIVAIHDAARFLVPASVAWATVVSAEQYGSGVAVCAIYDTVKALNGEGRLLHTLDRSMLRAAQTPQTFERVRILEAHERALREGCEATDDSALWERYVGPSHLVETPESPANRKFTTKEDLHLMLPRMPDLRIGNGYDAHRLTTGRKLILCGVEIPFERGLLGHSDADVAAHALMDALLGALALPDIGGQFPDTDPRYASICSLELLARVKELIAAQGYRVANVDVTIVAQRPKLAPYIGSMRENIARALCVPEGRVGVKATTTENMGFEGRGEGISASASALLSETL